MQEIAIGIILAKANRRRRAQRAYHRLLQIEERKLLPPISEWMRWTVNKLRAGLSRMHGKGAASMANSITDWAAIRARGDEIMKPVLLKALETGGNSVLGHPVRKQARFDVIGQEAIGWTTAHSAELVVQITRDTKFAIQEVIANGIAAGKSMPAIATELRPIVGLHSQYAEAVGNYHTSLLADGVAASKATAKAQTYAGRLHRRRTMTIARTESAYGLTEGQRQGYQQMGVNKLLRVEDPDCCDICLEYDGVEYTIAEANGALPEHPNCEGTWVAAPGKAGAGWKPPTTPTEMAAWGKTNMARAVKFADKEGVGACGPTADALADKMDAIGKKARVMFSEYMSTPADVSPFGHYVTIEYKGAKAVKLYDPTNPFAKSPVIQLKDGKIPWQYSNSDIFAVGERSTLDGLFTSEQAEFFKDII